MTVVDLIVAAHASCRQEGGGEEGVTEEGAFDKSFQPLWRFETVLSKKSRKCQGFFWGN